jgi:gliding-associated putative ABC transporter substrate-binding component GldG
MAKTAAGPKRGSKRLADLSELVVGIAIVGVLLFLASFVRLRADLTSEKRYTLRPATIELVKELEDIVYVKVYLTGTLPADLQRLSRATRDLLEELRVHQPDLVQFSFVDPNAQPDEKTRREVYAQLEQQGLRYNSITFAGQGAQTELVFFPGALVTYREKTVPVQLLRSRFGANDPEMVNRSINNLEYELAGAIRQATADRKRRIAFLEGHGELDGPRIMDITNELKEQYEVERVRIDGRIDALSHRVEGVRFRVNDYDALIIAKPDSTFPDRDRYVIDQFIMNGGRVLWFVDAMDPHLDSLRTKQFSLATSRELGIDELLFAYGARINKDLVLDQYCAPIEISTDAFGEGQKRELLPWYFEPVLAPLSPHPIVANIDPVHTRFASSVDTIGVDGVKKTVLLSSSPRSRLVLSPVRISLAITKMDMGFDRSTTAERPMAVLLEGKFTSAFADRLPPAFANDPEVAYREQGAPSAQLVVGDGDVIENRVDWRQGYIFELGWDRYRNGKFYGNKEFIVNAVNYLLNDRSLISVRARAITLRLLDRGRTVAQRRYWQVVNIAGPIALGLLAALLFALVRRRANRPYPPNAA